MRLKPKGLLTKHTQKLAKSSHRIVSSKPFALVGEGWQQSIDCRQYLWFLINYNMGQELAVQENLKVENTLQLTHSRMTVCLPEYYMCL